MKVVNKFVRDNEYFGQRYCFGPVYHMTPMEFGEYIADRIVERKIITGAGYYIVHFPDLLPHNRYKMLKNSGTRIGHFLVNRMHELDLDLGNTQFIQARGVIYRSLPKGIASADYPNLKPEQGFYLVLVVEILQRLSFNAHGDFYDILPSGKQSKKATTFRGIEAHAMRLAHEAYALFKQDSTIVTFGHAVYLASMKTKSPSFTYVSTNSRLRYPYNRNSVHFIPEQYHCIKLMSVSDTKSFFNAVYTGQSFTSITPDMDPVIQNLFSEFENEVALEEERRWSNI